ncbi:branched-chain amino acid ABC transporter permease [Paracraurococcus lichenis]|uniref:Branched-chain amino acid ABC transporter permease n=1 Tax=Paracraurococcus lichenis TaxID=3064888 RepID=A0ABT9E0R7_9PROT|nr:branched-chain amino acid ABC transporter permease [Paracraurococcus sp. LOR1-02]MDO9709764.1 branched-chain amino acid ABC transporter permease [Paracraurococcus sp. LOR1-02]
MSASKGLPADIRLEEIAAPAATPAWQRALLVLGGLAIAIAPIFVLESFHLFQLTMAVIMALAVLGLNIVSGYNGQISLGHGAFFAVGAYCTAILMSHLDWSFWATLPVSAVVCGIIGYGVGFPALRLAGHYLALTTFSLAVAVPQILKHKSIEDWTGGVQGLFLVKPDAPAGIPLTADQWMYVVTVIVAGVCFLLAWNLIRSRIGRALIATRDHPTAAEAMGMDIASLKTRAFAVSAIITGIAGSLSAVAVEFVAPDSFSFGVSITLFVGMVVGGVASILGSLFGGLFVLFVPNIAEAISKAAPGVIYGVILILFLFLLPDGFAGLLRRIAGRLRGRG